LISFAARAEHISIRSGRPVGFPRPKAVFEVVFEKSVFEGNFVKRFAVSGCPFAIWPGRPGIRNVVMLSDVDAAVTSQAGVLDFGFAVCQKQGCGAGRPSAHQGGSQGTDEIDVVRPALRDSAVFRASMPAFPALPSAHPPTSHLAAGRFQGYSLQPTLPSSSG
jgi:hypothetical protein